MRAADDPLNVAPPKRRLDVKNERERTLVREDYVTYRFFEWAKGVIASAKFN